MRKDETRHQTLHKTFGDGGFEAGVIKYGFGNWAGMSYGGFMNGLRPSQINSYAQKFKRKYDPVISKKNGMRVITSYGNQEKYDLDKEEYESNKHLIQEIYDNEAKHRRGLFSSPNGAEAMNAGLNDFDPQAGLNDFDPQGLNDFDPHAIFDDSEPHAIDWGDFINLLDI